MKRVILFLHFIFFISTVLQSQDLTIKRERKFTGEGLYGFMNGGADLYLEYGVQELITRDVVFKGEEYTIDIYTMPSSIDAFGIYSVNIFKCDKADELGCFDCFSTYQLLLSAGNKYISVVFQSGSDIARANASDLVKKYIDIDNEERIPIPSELQLSLPYSGRLKYLKGPISISNTDFSLSTMLEGLDYSDVWYILDRQTKDSKALVYLETKEDLKKLEGRVAKEDIIKVGEDFIYFNRAKKDEWKEDFGTFAF